MKIETLLMIWILAATLLFFNVLDKDAELKNIKKCQDSGGVAVFKYGNHYAGCLKSKEEKIYGNTRNFY